MTPAGPRFGPESTIEDKWPNFLNSTWSVHHQFESHGYTGVLYLHLLPIVCKHSIAVNVSSGVIQSHPGPRHPGSQGRWLIIRIRVIWLDLSLFVLKCTPRVYPFCHLNILSYSENNVLTNFHFCQSEARAFNVDERFFTSLHNYMLPIAGHECSHINHVKTPVNGDRLSNTLLKIAFSTSNFSDNMLLSAMLLPHETSTRATAIYHDRHQRSFIYRLVPAWRREARAGNDRGPVCFDTN